MKYKVEERIIQNGTSETVRTIYFPTEKEAKDYADLHNDSYSTTSDNIPIYMTYRDRYFFFDTEIEDKDLEYWSREEIEEGIQHLTKQLKDLKESICFDRKQYKCEKARLKREIRNYKRKFGKYHK